MESVEADTSSLAAKSGRSSDKCYTEASGKTGENFRVIQGKTRCTNQVIDVLPVRTLVCKSLCQAIVIFMAGVILLQSARKKVGIAGGFPAMPTFGSK